MIQLWRTLSDRTGLRDGLLDFGRLSLAEMDTWETLQVGGSEARSEVDDGTLQMIAAMGR